MKESGHPGLSSFCDMSVVIHWTINFGVKKAMFLQVRRTHVSGSIVRI